MIPDFTSAGTLPPGIHEATWEELYERFGYTEHRKHLLSGLEKAINDLIGAGCRKIYVNGSSVTNKQVPRDFDCCWEMAGVKRWLLKPVLLNTRVPRNARKILYYGDVLPAEGGMLEYFQRGRNRKPKGIIEIDPVKVPT